MSDPDRPVLHSNGNGPLLTKETLVCGELVMLHGVDGERWFSHPHDIEVYLWWRQKTESKLRPHSDRNLPMTRFAT